MTCCRVQQLGGHLLAQCIKPVGAEHLARLLDDAPDHIVPWVFGGRRLQPPQVDQAIRSLTDYCGWPASPEDPVADVRDGARLARRPDIVHARDAFIDAQVAWAGTIQKSSEETDCAGQAALRQKWMEYKRAIVRPLVQAQFELRFRPDRPMASETTIDLIYWRDVTTKHLGGDLRDIPGVSHVQARFGRWPGGEPKSILPVPDGGYRFPATVKSISMYSVVVTARGTCTSLEDFSIAFEGLEELEELTFTPAKFDGFDVRVGPELVRRVSRLSKLRRLSITDKIAWDVEQLVAALSGVTALKSLAACVVFRRVADVRSYIQRLAEVCPALESLFLDITFEGGRESAVTNVHSVADAMALFPELHTERRGFVVRSFKDRIHVSTHVAKELTLDGVSSDEEHM